jgi:hypothetical protein
MVTIVVELSSPHNKKRRDLVLLMLHQYALDDNILSDVADPSTYWARLCEIIWELTETARQAWLTLKAQFLGNRESRVMQFDARFCLFKPGDLRVSDYCHRLKGMTDDFVPWVRLSLIITLFLQYISHQLAAVP